VSEPRLRVVIADDHIALRMGVRHALEEAGWEVCADVGSASAAIAAATKHRPDVCLIDLSMPGGGISAVADISRSVPGTAVVVLSVSTDSNDMITALRAGAVGYLVKDMDPSGLPAALRAVVAGEIAIPRALVGRLVDEVKFAGRRRRLTDSGGRSVELTPREWEVLELLALDLPTAEIAARLQLDQVTVRRHVSGVVRKLDVKTRKDAVQLLNSPEAPR
jgi:two-component system, NarL family, nitrate/nitrite response regulator NarL